MPPLHLIRGQKGERLAEQYLRENGLKILSRNFHSRFGEIDLIALDQKQLVFIEVRVRTNQGFGSAVETVTIPKQRKLIKCAQYFISQHPNMADRIMRFDVIGIDGEQQTTWIKGAFHS